MIVWVILSCHGSNNPFGSSKIIVIVMNRSCCITNQRTSAKPCTEHGPLNDILGMKDFNKLTAGFEQAKNISSYSIE